MDVGLRLSGWDGRTGTLVEGLVEGFLKEGRSRVLTRGGRMSVLEVVLVLEVVEVAGAKGSWV